MDNIITSVCCQHTINIDNTAAAAMSRCNVHFQQYNVVQVVYAE